MHFLFSFSKRKLYKIQNFIVLLASISKIGPQISLLNSSDLFPTYQLCWIVYIHTHTHPSKMLLFQMSHRLCAYYLSMTALFFFYPPSESLLPGLIIYILYYADKLADHLPRRERSQPLMHTIFIFFI